MSATTVLIIPKPQIIRLLHEEHVFSDRFITHMLARNLRIEGDLVDQLFNSSEKRLARALLLLAVTASRSRHIVCCRGSLRRRWRNGRHDAVARELLHE